MTVALAVAFLGVGLALTPASVSLAKCKCGPKKRACATAHKDSPFFDCTGLVKKAKKDCKRTLRKAIKADCRGCVPKTTPCSPSGAFLD
jgi:hypothetical protein